MEEQSKNKGFLGSTFENFEHKPKDDLWDRIHSETTPQESTGVLSPVFQDYIYAPNKRVWNAISAELFPQRKKMILFWSWSAAASIIILIGSFFFFRNFTGNNTNIPDNNISKIVPVYSESEKTETISEKEISKKNIIAEEKSNINNGHIKEDVEELSNKNSNIIAYIDTEINKESLFRNLDPVKAKLQNLFNPEMNMVPVELLNFKRSKEIRKNSIDFASMLAANTNSLSLNGTEKAVYSNNELSYDGIDGLDGSEEILSSSYRSFYDEIEHDPPLSFGLIFSYSLGRKINLGTGLNYTRLHSIGTSFNYDWKTENYSTKNYIGIPINISYEFIQRRKISLFATSGFILELGLNEKNKVIEYNEDQKVDDYLEHKKINKGQAGLMLGFGANYHINTKLDFYLQTGSSHYFYLSHYNMWSDQKIWPSLQMGFRFKL